MTVVPGGYGRGAMFWSDLPLPLTLAEWSGGNSSLVRAGLLERVREM